MLNTETPVFRKTYDVSILKKIRDEIIDVLKKGNYKLTTTYNLSGAHPDSLRFVVTSLSKGQEGITRSLLQMRKCLTKGLDNLVTTSEVESSTDKFAVDVEQLYEEKKLLKDAASGVGGDASQNGNNGKLKKEEKRLGRKITEFGIFRDELIRTIEESANVMQNAKTTGFYITVVQGSPKTILLHCANEHVVETVVRVLETHETYEPKILKIVKDVIYIRENDVAENNERKSAVQFLERFLQEARDKEYALTLISSATVAIAKDPVVLHLRCSTAGEAATLAHQVNSEWNPTKNGAEVIFSLSKLVWKKALIQDTSFINKQESRGLVVTQRKDDIKSLVGTYVHSSLDYNTFHFLSFNRKRKKRHTNKIVKSMQRWGVLSFVTVAITDCIDGVMRMWIVDGQHRFDAMVILKNPILFTIANVNTKKDMVKLIAVLNHTSRNWSLRDYLTPWCSLDLPEYTLVQTTLLNTKLPITLILEVYSGLDRRLAAERFQDGDFEIVNEEKANCYIGYIMELRTALPRSRAILSCLPHLFNQYAETYDNNKMKDMIKATKANITKLPFAEGDTVEITLRILQKIYQGDYVKRLK